MIGSYSEAAQTPTGAADPVSVDLMTRLLNRCFHGHAVGAERKNLVLLIVF
jgi:hypothetical protein